MSNSSAISSQSDPSFTLALVAQVVWPAFRTGRRHFLRKLGYRILGCNLADVRGEIDLLALDGSTLVFVEVRSTETRDCADCRPIRRREETAETYQRGHSISSSPTAREHCLPL